MTSRQLLYMILSFVITIVVMLLVVVVVLLLQKPRLEVNQVAAVQEAPKVEKRKKGKWEGKEKRAVSLVKKLKVPNPARLDVEKKPRRGRKAKEVEEIPETVSIKELVDQKFFDAFKLDKLEFVGWQAQYLKKSYYFVSYTFRDELVNVGPVWLVDVKRKKVIAKNAMALAATKSSTKTPEKAFFKREADVVEAISGYKFQEDDPNGINLGGSMLIYFTNMVAAQEGTDGENDRILGWTIIHDYGNVYRAYFQWVEEGENTYAEFECEFDPAGKKHKLRGRNLQAANLMQLGRDFEGAKRVSILPTSYERGKGWTKGPCVGRRPAPGCAVLTAIYKNRELVESVEWLLTATADTAAQFETCKSTRHCCWIPKKGEKGSYRVIYGYDLENTPKPGAINKPDNASCQKAIEGKNTVSWSVNPKNNVVTPDNPISDMAYRAVRPRSQLAF